MKISRLLRHSQPALLIAAMMMPFSSVTAEAGKTTPESPITHAMMTYTSGPRNIVIERFSVESNSPQPAIVLVHGADGLQSPVWNARYREYARQLAARGFVVYFPHYFERTGSEDSFNAKQQRAQRRFLICRPTLCSLLLRVEAVLSDLLRRV